MSKTGLATSVAIHAAAIGLAAISDAAFLAAYLVGVCALMGYAIITTRD